MKNIYYYIHTGQHFGLERFRRAVAIIRELDAEVTLLCSDYRIASDARRYGIKKAIGIDVLRNIPNVAKAGDILIYDSPEHNDAQLTEMIDFFSIFIRISEESNDKIMSGEYIISPYLKGENICNAWPIASSFFEERVKKHEKILFFGDDDFERYLPQKSAELRALNLELLMGFYYFFDYEKELKNCFPAIHESEEYEDVISSSKIVVTSSFQCALEVLASGGKPILWQRDDYPKSLEGYLRVYGIPIVSRISDIEKLLDQEHNYKKIENEMPTIKEFIESKLK